MSLKFSAPPICHATAHKFPNNDFAEKQNENQLSNTLASQESHEDQEMKLSDPVLSRRSATLIFLAIFAAGAGLFYWAIHPEGGGLVSYRWQSNQYSAHYALKTYVSAQVNFSVAQYAKIQGNTSPDLGDNAFADNFRNLYYGKGNASSGEPLSLISKDMADAFLVDNALRGAPTPPEAPTVSVPYKGYVFQEDIFGMIPRSEYSGKCALMAFPAVYGKTGYKVFWIGVSENESDARGHDSTKVFEFDPDVSKGTPASEIAKLFYASTPPPSNNPLIKWKER